MNTYTKFSGISDIYVDIRRRVGADVLSTKMNLGEGGVKIWPIFVYVITFVSDSNGQVSARLGRRRLARVCCKSYVSSVSPRGQTEDGVSLGASTATCIQSRNLALNQESVFLGRAPVLEKVVGKTGQGDGG